MKIDIYQVDAFTSKVFKGNPAAVCPLEKWLPDELMQAIAMENNLSETAFFVPEKNGYAIRWFTPEEEVDLCGHATLASAFVIFNFIDPKAGEIRFSSQSGPLSVARDGERLVLDFPSRPPAPVEPSLELVEAVGPVPSETGKSRDYFLVYETEDAIRSIAPDLSRLANLDALGIIVTAPGDEADFVSRFFAPGAGVPEDPVTGSAHSTLVPYWAKRLGKKELYARQISKRGGELWCRDEGERVKIAGEAALYMKGEIEAGIE